MGIVDDLLTSITNRNRALAQAAIQARTESQPTIEAIWQDFEFDGWGVKFSDGYRVKVPRQALYRAHPASNAEALVHGVAWAIREREEAAKPKPSDTIVSAEFVDDERPPRALLEAGD